MKRKILLIIGILIFADIFYFSYVNSGLVIDFNYKPIIDSFKFDNGLIIAIMSIYAALGTYLICYFSISKRDEKLKKLSRKSEKASLDSEESDDKVKMLEAKIQTLEIALQEALKKN